jgi:hypothetical protein
MPGVLAAARTPLNPLVLENRKRRPNAIRAPATWGSEIPPKRIRGDGAQGTTVPGPTKPSRACAREVVLWSRPRREEGPPPDRRGRGYVPALRRSDERLEHDLNHGCRLSATCPLTVTPHPCWPGGMTTS